MSSPALTLPHERRILRAFGEEVQLLLTGAETGGRFAQWIEITPPGNGPPPHYHTQEEEWFHVLEGRFAFFKDQAWTEVPEGTAVFLPRNSIHTFKNVGDRPGRLLVTTSPAGFETFFARCAEEFARPGAPDMDRIVAISAEHGIHYVTD